jgi:hypothetical protein
MSIILLLCYPLAVQVERGGWWLVLAPFTLCVLAIDVLANYTELALLSWDFPQRKEYTFSTRLLRLKHDTGWRGKASKPIITYLNYFAPNGKHV